MTEEDKSEQLQKRKEIYAKRVADKKEDERKKKMRKSYMWNQNSHERERMRKKRETRSIEEIEFDCVEQVIRRRKARSDRDKEAYAQDNLVAKKGMQDLNSIGRMMPMEFSSSRSGQN